jgi:hypothetical protein
VQRSGQDGEHLRVPLGTAALPADGSRVAIAPPSVHDDEYDDMDGVEGDADAEPKPLGQAQLIAKARSLPFLA